MILFQTKLGFQNFTGVGCRSRPVGDATQPGPKLGPMPKKWTKADVKASKNFKQSAAPQTVQPEIAVPNLRKQLAKFWSQKSEGFKSMWASLTRADRERLIRTSCPQSRRPSFSLQLVTVSVCVDVKI